MSKYIQLSVVFGLLMVLGACGLKPPIDDDSPPIITVVASDSTYNINNPFSYMRYDTSGPGPEPFAGVIGQRTETGFVTKDGSATFRVVARDVGGIKALIIRAQNGTISSEPHAGLFRTTTEITTEDDTDILVISNAEQYAITPIEQIIAISPKTDNPEVIVSVEALDMGGITGRSNTTTVPDIRLVFSSQ